MANAAADGRRYELLRVGLADGSETTVYAVVHPRRATRVRVTCFAEAERLDRWCAANGQPEAIVAGFFVRRPVAAARGGPDRRPPARARAVNEDELFAVCCDGRRTGVDAGLDLPELARLLISLGATDAINLDGGGSATLVHRGHLLNRPYSSVDQAGPEFRPIVTAVLFERGG